MTDRRLAPVAAAVLAAHVAFLQLAPAPQRSAQAQAGTMTFTTRTVQPAPAPQATPVAATPARVAAAPPPPSRAPKSQRPQRAPAATEAVQPAPASTAATPTPESTVAQAEPPAASPAEPSAGVAFTPGTDVELGAGLTRPPGPDANDSAAFLIPEPVKLRYDVVAQNRFGFRLSSTAELTWKHDGQQYEAVLEAGGGLIPKRIQRSTGRITPDGLAPLRFSDRSRSEQATHFEREKGVVTFSNNKPQGALAAGMQDRLSIVVQLAAMVGGAPARFPVGSSIRVPTAGTGDTEEWIFTVEGEEELDLPGGRMKGLRLQRTPRKEYDVKVELWLAPAMDYAPVRLRLTNPNGDMVDQRWAATDRG